jgi:hypothetical protein
MVQCHDYEISFVKEAEKITSDKDERIAVSL